MIIVITTTIITIMMTRWREVEKFFEPPATSAASLSHFSSNLAGASLVRWPVLLDKGLFWRTGSENVTLLARKKPCFGFLSLGLEGKPIELRIRPLYVPSHLFKKICFFFVTIVRRKRLRIFFWKFWWSWWLTSVGKYRGNKIGRGGAKAQHTPTNQSINQNFSKHFGNPLLTPMHY